MAKGNRKNSIDFTVNVDVITKTSKQIDGYVEKLREIISEQLEISEELITMESNIRDDFDADSLDLVDIVMSVEEIFKVKVEKVTTINYAGKPKRMGVHVGKRNDWKTSRGSHACDRI